MAACNGGSVTSELVGERRDGTIWGGKHEMGAVPFYRCWRGRFIPEFGIIFPFKRTCTRDKIREDWSSNRVRFG